MVLSLRKGKTFEREVVHLLDKITGGAKWFRTSGSGAMHTAQGIEDHRYKGDLFSEDPRFAKVLIECKIQRKPINLQDLYNLKSNWNSWLKQTREESCDLFWLLFFRWNAGDLMMVANTVDMTLLKTMFDVPIQIVLQREGLTVVTFG
jgi:hypothetical protein